MIKSLLSALFVCTVATCSSLGADEVTQGSVSDVAQSPLAGNRVISRTVSPPTVVELGPHHRVWHYITEEVYESGEVVTVPHSYTELTTGMHYLEAGAWRESSATFEIFDKGAVARKMQHQLILAPNPNTADAVDLLTPDSQRLVSHVLGLSYYDAASGKSVMIAELKDSQGELLADNE